jgi:hypothetical protein
MMAFVGAFFAFTVHKAADVGCAKVSGFVSTIVLVFSAWIAKAAEFVLVPKLKHHCETCTPSALDEE